MTLVKFVQTAHSGNSYETPAAGRRYFAIQWRIKNVGTVAYEDSPSNGTTVADASGQQFQSTIVTSISAGEQISSSLKLAPGRTGLGYITYDVATGTKVVTAQFGTNSGMGSTGDWTF